LDAAASAFGLPAALRAGWQQGLGSCVPDIAQINGLEAVVTTKMDHAFVNCSRCSRQIRSEKMCGIENIRWSK
jgi:hypothetical protein